MDPFAHGDTIPLMFSAMYDIYSNISEPHEIFYRVVKVLHQIGINIHGFIHDMTTTHNADFIFLHAMISYGLRLRRADSTL